MASATSREPEAAEAVRAVRSSGDDVALARRIWAANRFRMETENRKTRRYGGYGRQRWYLLQAMGPRAQVVPQGQRPILAGRP